MKVACICYIFSLVFLFFSSTLTSIHILLLMERLKQTCPMRHVWSMWMLLIVWFTIIFHTIKNLILSTQNPSPHSPNGMAPYSSMSMPSIMHMLMPPPPTPLHLVTCQVTMRWMRTMETPTGIHPVWKMSSECNSWISRCRRFQEKTSSEFFYICPL